MLTLPENAPFTGPQRMWLKGFLDGLSAFQPPAPNRPILTEKPSNGQAVTLLWGSQTGTAETFAKKLAKNLTAKGHSTTVLDMADVNIAQLSSMKNLLILTSTYGDGEPPDNALNFHSTLHADSIDLTDLRFSIFALGDSNYPDFCKCGHDFQNRLTALGATPLTPITESDVDHDLPFMDWSARILSALVIAR